MISLLVISTLTSLQTGHPPNDDIVNFIIYSAVHFNQSLVFLVSVERKKRFVIRRNSPGIRTPKIRFEIYTFIRI